MLIYCASCKFHGFYCLAWRFPWRSFLVSCILSLLRCTDSVPLSIRREIWYSISPLCWHEIVMEQMISYCNVLTDLSLFWFFAIDLWTIWWAGKGWCSFVRRKWAKLTSRVRQLSREPSKLYSLCLVNGVRSNCITALGSSSSCLVHLSKPVVAGLCSCSKFSRKIGKSLGDRRKEGFGIAYDGWTIPSQKKKIFVFLMSSGVWY